MTTQRKTTGASALVDIMKEVYDTKLRMKATINKVIETNSDDFEEYATLTHNAIVKEYNRGIAKGYADGWHVVFPSAQITPDMYEEYYHSYNTYTPSIPTYTTDTDVDNLVVMMRDNLRCRLLLKNELSTNSDEFVTYPDLLEELYVFSYQDGYDDGYQQALDDATAASYIPPTINQSPWGETITIINNADFGDIYYWFNDSIERHLYTGPFIIEEHVVIHAYMQYNGRISKITTKDCRLYKNEYFTIDVLEDVDNIDKIYLLQGDYGKGTRGQYTYNYPRVYYRINDGEVNEVNYKYYQEDIVWISDVSSLKTGDKIQINLGENYWSNTVITITPYCELTNGTYYYFNYNISGNIAYLLQKNPTNTLSSDFNRHITFANDNNEIHDYPGNHVLSMYNLYIPFNIETPLRFRFCRNLITGPKIMVNFKNSSYIDFRGCNNLVSMPDISISIDNTFVTSASWTGLKLSGSALREINITLTDGVTNEYTASKPHFEYIFSDCTDLTKAVVNFNNICSNSQELCQYMFCNCTSLNDVTFNINYDIENNSLPYDVFYHMFDGCTSLVNAPDLLWGLQRPGAYAYMFSGCSNLKYIKCLLTANYDIGQTNWVDGVSASGTFVKKTGQSWKTGINGIPSGWTVQEV